MFTYKFKHPNTGKEITFTSETELSEEQVRNLIDDIISRDSSGAVKTSDDSGFFEKVKGYNNTITRGFQGGVLRLAGLLQDDPEIGKAYYDTADEIDSEWDESVRKSGVDPEGFFAQAAQAGGNMVPLIGGTVITGALTGGTAPVVAFGSYMAAMQGASGWQAEASSKEYDRLMGENPSLSKRDAAVLSMENTQNQATIQGLKTGGITLAGGLLASKFGFGGIETGRAAAGVAPKGFKAGAKAALGSAAFEGLEEAADSLATTGLDWSQGWEDEDITLGQAFKRAGNDFVVGFILGGAIETGRVSLDKLSEDSSESEKLAKALASSEEKAKEEGEPFNSALEKVLSNVNELSKSSASKWAREQLGNPKDLKESALLEMKISEIRRAKIVRDLDSEIEMLEAEEAASSEIKSVSEKQRFRDELGNLKKVRDEFKSGARDPLDIEDQQILDSLGLKSAEEAYNAIKSGGSIPLTRDDGAVVTSITQRGGEGGEGGNATDALGLTQKQPEQDIEEEVSEPEDKSMSSEVLSGSKTIEAKLDQTLKDADKLFSERNAQKRRREGQAEEESGSPRTSFNFKQPPEEEAPSKSSDPLKSNVAGAGMTAAEQRARSAQISGKGPFQSAPQVRDRRAGQEKVDEAESRAKGKKVTYGGAENTVSEIVNESAANADIDGSTRGADGSVKDVGPSEIVDNAISEAEAQAEEAGVNLTEGDKASIARKISERAEKGIPAAESATIQDGLKSLITAIESRLKRFQRSNAPLFNDPFFIGTIASSFPAAKRVALNAAKRALKAGISASDAADIAILKSKSYLKKNKIRISTEEELGLEFGVLEGISKDLIRASDSRGEKKFYPSDSSSLKRARGNKNLKEDLDVHNESTPTDGRKINLPDLDDSQSYSDARTYMDSHIFGDISGKRERDARPVLRPVKEEFTIRTTPKDHRAVGEVLGKGEDSKRKALSWENRKLSQNKPHSVRLDVSSLRNHKKYVSTIYNSTNGKGRVAGYAPVSSTIVDVDGGGIKLDAVPVLAVIEKGRKYPMSYVVGLRNEVEIDLENKVVRELDSGAGVRQPAWTAEEAVEGKIPNAFYGTQNMEIESGLSLDLSSQENISKGTGQSAEGVGRYATSRPVQAEYFATDRGKSKEDYLIYEYDLNISEDAVLYRGGERSPLKLQPKVVQEAWKDFVEMLKENPAKNKRQLELIDKYGDSWNGVHLYAQITDYFGAEAKKKTGKWTPEAIYEGQRLASLYLKEKGVDALSYRRGDGADMSRNRAEGKYPAYIIINTSKARIVSVKNKAGKELLKEEAAPTAREISFKDLHNTDKWSQVAINPRRAGYAYDRLSGLPVSGFVKGTKLINLGGTVFVEGPENVVYGDPLDFLNVPLAKLVMMRKKLKRWMGSGSRNKRVGHYMSFMGVGAVGQVTLKMVDNSLGLAIDAIIAGRKSVNEAIEIAFNSFSALDRKMVDRDDFINAMRGKLAIAIERITSGDSEKAAISFAIKATQVVPVSKIETIDKIEEESSIEDFNLSKFIEKYEYLDRNAEIASDIENLSVSRFNRVGGLFDLFDALSSGLRKLSSNQYVANSIGLQYFANALRSFSSNKINFQRLYGTELASLMTASEKVVGEFGGEINAEVGAYLRLQAQAVKGKKDMPSMDGLSDRAKKIVALRNKVFALQGAHAKQYRVMKKKDGKWVEGEFNMGEYGHYQTMESGMVSSLIKLAENKSLNSTDRDNIQKFIKAHDNKDENFAKRWAKKNFGPKEGNNVLIVATSDRLSSLEKSREIELPLDLVDFGINSFMKQSSAWATRMAQIASFGQSTTETTDIFDAYIDMLTDRGDKDGASETLKIIKSARDDVYGMGILEVPKFWVNSTSFLSRWTSLLHMVSIASLLTQMTSVGNAAVKIQSMRGLARVTGSLIKLMVSGNTLSFGDVEALNVTGGVARAMVGNYTDGTELSNGVEKVLRIGGVAFAATAGLGDRITRVIAANVANAALHSVRSARESGTNSDFVEEMQAFCKEHGLEYESVVNGDKEAVAQFYIAFVGETQFTYSETQRASASNNFWFKSIFRYYEFSSQMMEFTHRNISRSYDRHGFAAAATSTVFTVAMAGLSAELITQLRQLVGIRPEDDETWEEIANRDGVIDKVVGVGERWLENLNNAAVFGFLSYAYNTAKFKHGDYSLTDIPIFSAARKIESIASDESKPRDVKIEEIVSEINFLKKPYNEAISVAGKFGSDNKSARIKNAEFQKRKIRSILNRFEEQTDGFEFGGGYSRPSEVAYYANQVAESLYLGDIAEAKDRALIFADQSTDKEQSWSNLTRMVKSRQPLHLRGSLNKKEKDQFKTWAEKNLSESDQKEVRDASLNYIQTALDAGLITVDGKNPDEKNLMKMKEAMTGVVKKKSRTPLTSGKDSEYRKLFDRKRSSPIGVK